MRKKKKIFLIIPKYKVGGAERVIIKLSDELINFNLEVFVIILTKSTKLILNNKVRVIYLNANQVFKSIFKLKDIIEVLKPDVCLSTISHTNIALYIASKLSKHSCRIFLRESNNIFESTKNSNFFYRIFYLNIVKYLYRKANLITPSKKLSNEIKKKFRIKRKVYSIVNPIIDSSNKLKSIKKYDFINIGSLTYQKDQITLLKAFKILNYKKKSKLLIIGEGNLKKIIYNFILKNNLKKNVTIFKNKKNVGKYLIQSKIFVSTSKYEGYPNVLLDAANTNTPIISSNCNFGPSEILENGKYGKLFKVGDYNKLCEIMLSNLKLIKPIPKIKLKQNNVKVVAKKYHDLFFQKNI